jgi:hypothetical protein
MDAHGNHADTGLSPALEARLCEVEAAAALEPGFTARDWGILIATGVLLPLGLIVWGWPA